MLCDLAAGLSTGKNPLKLAPVKPQSLIQGVNVQMEKIKVQIDYLKEKLKIIDSQEEKN